MHTASRTYTIFCRNSSPAKKAGGTFDWGGLFHRLTRVGVRYYELLQLEKGDFYNLIVPEITADGYTLYDIDEMEKIILDHIQEPIPVAELFTRMHAYAEDDILQYNLAAYEHLVLTMLQQLVLKKAIQPANM